MVGRVRNRIGQSLRLRFAVSIAVLVAVIGGSIALVGARVLEDALVETQSDATARIARHVADHHRAVGDADLQTLLVDTIEHADGVVGAAIYEARIDAPAWSRIAVLGDRGVPVILTAPPVDEDTTVAHAANGTELVIVTRPLDDAGRFAVRIATSLDAVSAVGARAQAVLLALAAMLVALGALFGDRVGRGWLTPLRNLLDAMRDVTNGRFGRRLDTTDRDELGFLARRFNMMARALERHRDEAEQYATELERRVRSRTAELERANLALRTLDRAKDAFLSNVSHEMRTPLTSIMASIEILKDYGDSDSQARREFLTIVDQESQRLLTLIDRVLEIVALEAAPMVLDCGIHRVDDIVDESIRNVRMRTESRQVTILLHSAQTAAKTFCDRERIIRVLDGILDNAIKFSPNGATIDVTVDARESDARIRIRDEGPGLDPEHAEGVFAKFVQVGQSLTEKPRGFGLGLPVARRIAEAHGGTISYERELGFGATFVLQLPLTNDRHPTKDDAGAEPKSSPEPLTTAVR